jgi:uncharacterized protein (DUF3820 family)
MDDKQLAANMVAREASVAVHDLIISEASNHKGRACVIFYEVLLRELRSCIGDDIWPRAEVARDLPMTEKEAKAFESKNIDFGKYAGTAIKDVDVGYLVWLEEQPDFRRRLNRYLRRTVSDE